MSGRDPSGGPFAVNAARATAFLSLSPHIPEFAMIPLSKPFAAVATSALLLLCAVQAPDASARERAGAQRPQRAMPQRQVQRPPQARPVSRTTETQRTDTGYVRNTTLTRPDGATATSQRTVVNDREAGTHSVDVTRTGFDGKTRSMSHDVQRTEDGWTSSRTLTNAQGETATRNTSVSIDKEAGVRTRESELTTFDGRTASSTTVTTRTEDGFKRETSGTLPNGKEFERTVVKECDRDARKCTTTVTNGAGQP